MLRDPDALPLPIAESRETLEPQEKKGKKREDYAFGRQINEKPRIIPGCPVVERQPLTAWQGLSAMLHGLPFSDESGNHISLHGQKVTGILLCCAALLLHCKATLVYSTALSAQRGQHILMGGMVNSQKAESDWVQCYTTQAALRATALVTTGSSTGQMARPQPLVTKGSSSEQKARPQPMPQKAAAMGKRQSHMSQKAAAMGKRQGHSPCHERQQQWAKGKATCHKRQQQWADSKATNRSRKGAVMGKRQSHSPRHKRQQQ